MINDKDLAKQLLSFAGNSEVQNKAASLFGMLFPYAGLRKTAVDMYIKEISESDLSIDAKTIAVLNAKKQLKDMQINQKLQRLHLIMRRKGQIFRKTQGLMKSGLIDSWNPLRLFHLMKCNMFGGRFCRKNSKIQELRQSI